MLFDGHTTVESRHETRDGEEVWRGYEVGRYLVEIRESDGAVRYATRRSTQRGRDDVDVDVDPDGEEIRISIRDLIRYAVERVEPEALADIVWQHDEVKTHLMNELTERYAAMSDADQRDFLDRVQENVWARQLDDVSRSLARSTIAVQAVSDVDREVTRINDALASLDVRDANGEPLRVAARLWRDRYNYVGRLHTDMAEYWRNRIAALLPLPGTEPGEDAGSVEDERLRLATERLAALRLILGTTQDDVVAEAEALVDALDRCRARCDAQAERIAFYVKRIEELES